MPALLSIALFELKYQLRGPVFITAFLFFGLLVFGGVTVDNIQIGASNAVNINSPFATTTMVLTMSLTGMFIPTALLSSGVLRDLEMGTAPIIYSTPVSPRAVVLGRFLGGFAASALAFASVPLGAWIGAHMPWLDPEMLGATRILDYVEVYLKFGVTNLLTAGLFLFSVANLTRSSIATYVALVAALMIYLTGLSLAEEPGYRETIALLDPFGIVTFETVTRYWTPIERNTLVAPLTGLLLVNRLIWGGLALALLALNVFTYRFRTDTGRRLRSKDNDEPAEHEPPPKAIPSPTVRPSFDAPTMWTQLWARTRIEAASIVRSPAFWLLLALGLFNSIAGMVFSRSLYGLTTYPVTRRLIDILQGSFEFIPVVVMIYYSGELVSRDRRINAHEMIDAAPVPSWVLFVSKLAGLSLVVTSLMTAASLGAMAVQLAQGYTQLELDQYLVRVLLLNNAALILRGVLCLFLQALLGNRWLGMLAMVLYIILDITLSNIGFEDRLYHFADVPPIRYSDMNGYGQFLLPNLAFLAYYFFGSLILSVLAFGLWGRGEVSAPWRRAARLPRQLNRTAVSLLVGAAVLAAGLGSYIYHNTHRLNPYLTRDDEMDRAARYEEKYGELETAPSPKIVGVEAEVDIFPEERRYEVRGRYVLENRTEAPLSMVHVDVPFDLRLKAQALEGAQLDRTDLDLGHYVWKLEAPWPPGERRLLTFETERSHPGFANRDNTSRVTGNGTFFDNGDAMPQLSFAADKLLQDRPERRERGLRKRPRAPRLEDASTYHQGALRTDSDWVTFTTTVSTSRDQIAIAPGYLEKTWVAGGRPHFLYRMDSPIQNFFSYLSGEFAVREEMHGPIKLQVFHHAPHSYNVDGMIDGMKKALDYGSKNLSPFQYRQMRIFEFPSFMGTFAQSFPNSVPYSEAIGFIVDVRDPDEIDAILYVTAHEVAHQWFGHQLSAAPNQGATMLIESFAQYMALMVLEDALGEDVMRRFLKYELDSYLTGRGGELIEELPLYRVENQPYIHYRKGSLAMYALKDYFGEDRVNRVLRRLIAERGFSAEPYPLSTDFLDRLRAEARNDTERRLIEDLFEKIVLFDLKVEEASAVERPDGKWAVDLKVSARKLEADGEGRESEVPLDLPIDIGVFSKSLDGPLDPSPGARGGHVLHLQKQRLTTGTHEIHLVVDERPVVVGVDPYNKLVDRDSEDNLRQL